jgi:hypothetical protein
MSTVRFHIYYALFAWPFLSLNMEGHNPFPCTMVHLQPR